MITWSLKTRMLVAAGLLVLGAGAVGTLWMLQGPDPGKRFQTALAALDQGNLKEASDAARVLQDEPGFQSHVRLLRGGVLMRSGDPEAALREFALLVPKGEIRVPAMLLTTECLYRLGRLGEAEHLARQLAVEHPDNADARRWLGAIYYDLGANTQAIAELEKLAELEPGDYACHRLMGIMYLDFDEYAQAIDHFRKALSRSPPPKIQAELRENLAEALVAQRAYREALDELRSARPTSRVLALRAECYWSLNQKDRAEQLLERARQQSPDARFVLMLEARMRLAEGQPQAAVDPLKRLLQLDRHDAEARYQLAQAYRRLGRVEDFQREMAQWESSKELLDRLTELNIAAIEKPSDGGIRRKLANVCDALGKHELADMWRRAAGAYTSPQQTAE